MVSPYIYSTIPLAFPSVIPQGTITEICFKISLDFPSGVLAEKKNFLRFLKGFI